MGKVWTRANAQPRRKFLKSAIAATTSFALAEMSGVSAQTPSVIRLVSSWERPLSFNKPVQYLVERVKENSKGRLRIDFIGGPEAVPVFQGADAVARGVFDMIYTSPTFFASSVPEANALYLREDLSLAGLYNGGIVKALDQLCREKMGNAFVGVPAGGVGFTFFMRERPTGLEFFKGKKIRTTPLYTPLLKALGASTVTTTPAEVYQALERGVVDGVAWPLNGVVERKFYEVAKYMVLPAYYDARFSLLMNARKFDSMAPDLRDELLTSIHETEAWGYKWFKDGWANEMAQLKKLGIVEVQLSEQESKKYLHIANEAMWEQIISKSPERGARLKNVFDNAGN